MADDPVEAARRVYLDAIEKHISGFGTVGAIMKAVDEYVAAVRAAQTPTMADPVHTARQWLIDNTAEDITAAVDALIAAVRAEKTCTCGNMARAGGRYGHLHWCPLWEPPGAGATFAAR